MTSEPIRLYQAPTSVGDGVLLRQDTLPAALEMLGRDPALPAAADLLISTLRRGHKVLAAGNGGSAAEAQHFAAELVGRFQRERAPYAAIALTVDSSILTAVANDYGYEQVFARQVGALGQPGDLFLAYSTSGESPNLLAAALEARHHGLSVVAVTGACDSSLTAAADIAIRAPVPATPLVQEVHVIVTHLLCDAAERALTEGAE
ncbi:MAG TPA: SIS domain-containing protein [Chloroflexota bacterium]|nr:SIS domain-containing protein [Chloroflexota bacterium]